MQNSTQTVPSCPESKDDDIEIIDDKLIRPRGMTRLPPQKPTPFQAFLDDLAAHPEKLSSNVFPTIARRLLDVPSPGKPVNKSRLFSANDSVIVDAWNDNCRRFFETCFARKLLDYSLEKNATELTPLIEHMTAFLLREYRNDFPSFVEKWEAACKGPIIQQDESLDFFASQRPDVKTLIEQQHFKASGNTLLHLYDMHYLVHRLTKINAYGEYFPRGMFEIYRRFRPGKKSRPAVINELFDGYHTAQSLTQPAARTAVPINDPGYPSFEGNKHPLYRVTNRGRVISHFGFCKDAPGVQLGILRSIDPTPVDFRKPISSATTTRCPDRLYISNPAESRTNPASWHQFCFANPLNSGFVLGLSGSTLLELRSLLFFMTAVNDNYYVPETGNRIALSGKDPEIIKKYLLMVMGMFVYVEGGHTLSEILTVLDIPEVKNGVHNVLEGRVKLSKQTLIFDQPDIMALLAAALLETVQYRTIQREKQDLHAELKSLRA